MLGIEKIKKWAEENLILDITRTNYEASIKNYEEEYPKEFKSYNISDSNTKTNFHTISISFLKWPMDDMVIIVKLNIYIDNKFSGEYKAVYKYPDTEIIDDYLVMY